MAIGVTFPENEDVVTFGWKNEMLVGVEKQVRLIQKRIGQLCWISAEKSEMKGFTLLRHGDFTKCSNTCETGFHANKTYCID